jgi:hypothetical protein
LIRIVGIEKNENPEKEFVLLQNQGGLRINLRGHLVLTEEALGAGDLGNAAHIFSDDTFIPPGMYVLLSTGRGTPRWLRTKDGAMVYYAYMGRPRPVWSGFEGPVHLLSMQHTYTGRRETFVLR